jgi:predicted GTPase
LYGGHLVLDDVAFDSYQTRRSRRETRRARTQAKRLEEEPLRILVLGQVKSGKSSLVNALFGDLRAAVDVVPTTRHVEPYVLERDGLPRAIILDTAGYDQVDRGDDPFADLRDQILDCDLVIAVSSAVSAAREADRRLLDRVRALFQAEPDRVMPPLVVALTHVDRLRPPAEWDPPYDLVNPSGLKAEQILGAVRATEQDLGLVADQVVVPVCLRQGQLYNVEEGLAPVLIERAPEAERVKYLRCLRHHHEEEYWHRLWRQAVNSGRVLVKVGTAWARRTKGG